MARNRTKNYIFLSLGLICTALIGGFIFWANQPVSDHPNQTSVQGTSIEKAFKPISTDIFSTLVPDTLVVKDQTNDAHGSTLNQIFLTSNLGTPGNPITDQLAITVGKIPSDGLSGLSNIQFRLNHEGLYLPQEGALVGENSMTFIKTEQGYEKSVFWEENGFYAAVVVSGTVDRLNTLNEDLDKAIESWEWLAE